MEKLRFYKNDPGTLNPDIFEQNPLPEPDSEDAGDVFVQGAIQETFDNRSRKTIHHVKRK